MESQHEQVNDPAKIQAKVNELFTSIGCFLTDLEAPAVLVDALCKDCPIVGATQGFCQLTGYPLDQVIGQNCRLMLQGIPTTAISRSSRQNLRDFCAMCRVKGITNIAEVTCIAANARRDGSHFVNLFMLGLVKIHHHIFILGVHVSIGEGLLVRVVQPEPKIEACRHSFRSIRAHLIEKCAEADVPPLLDSDNGGFSRQSTGQLEFAFFSQRLQDHCLLTNKGHTVIRREPFSIANSCMVFGDRPMQHMRDGVSFSVHVDEVVSTFEGFPLLGFTKRCPKDTPDLYPVVSRCLGTSVLVGACGEAFARDQFEHFALKFKQPNNEQVRQWSLSPSTPSHLRTAPQKLQRGDVLCCKYLYNGHIQLSLNEETILDFDVERPLDEKTDYYAVVDVCLSAYSLTLVPSAHDQWESLSVSSEEQFTCEISFHPEDAFCGRNRSVSADTNVSFGDVDVSAKVNEVLVMQSIQDAVKSCSFMVTIADPRSPDCPLIAVSNEFLSMTGYDPSEIIGVNCRFLNQGCHMDPEDLQNLRQSVETGNPFAAVLENRKKSGELFLNLLDLRGLSVAKNPETGEELWFLIGVQADVTDVADGEIPQDNWDEMRFVADAIRSNIATELARMAIEGAVSLPPLETDCSPKHQRRPGAYRLFPQPSWVGIEQTRSYPPKPELAPSGAESKPTQASVQTDDPSKSQSNAEEFKDVVKCGQDPCRSREAIFGLSVAIVLVCSAWMLRRRLT